MNTISVTTHPKTNKSHDSIFLEFDETSEEWGGPYEYNGKYGCLVDIIKENQEETVKTITFSNADQYAQELENVSYALLWYYNFRLFLYGTDNCSFSKGFNTIEELNVELDTLTKLQPLNMKLDVYDRGYIYTN